MIDNRQSDKYSKVQMFCVNPRQVYIADVTEVCLQSLTS